MLRGGPLLRKVSWRGLCHELHVYLLCEPGQEEIKQAIQKEHLDRIVGGLFSENARAYIQENDRKGRFEPLFSGNGQYQGAYSLGGLDKEANTKLRRSRP